MRTKGTSNNARKNDSTVRQSLLIGLGLFDLSRAKVERYLSSLKKDLPAKDRKKAADAFITSIKSNSKTMEHSVRRNLTKALNQISSKIDPDRR